jgi:hypothetical protein
MPRRGWCWASSQSSPRRREKGARSSVRCEPRRPPSWAKRMLVRGKHARGRANNARAHALVPTESDTPSSPPPPTPLSTEKAVVPGAPGATRPTRCYARRASGQPGRVEWGSATWCAGASMPACQGSSRGEARHCRRRVVLFPQHHDRHDVPTGNCKESHATGSHGLLGSAPRFRWCEPPVFSGTSGEACRVATRKFLKKLSAEK